jgi:dephospho-CoA kinase
VENQQVGAVVMLFSLIVVTHFLKENDIEVIDLDFIARDVTKKGTRVYNHIVKTFGTDFLNEDSTESFRF